MTNKSIRKQFKEEMHGILWAANVREDLIEAFKKRGMTAFDTALNAIVVKIEESKTVNQMGIEHPFFEAEERYTEISNGTKDDDISIIKQVLQ